MRLARVLLSGLLGLGYPVAAAAAPCPGNAWYSGSGSGLSTAPAANFGGASYDLVAGTFGVSTSGGGELGNNMFLSIGDTYQLIGPASATPVAIRARVDLTGFASAEFMSLPGGLSGCFTSVMQFELRETSSVSIVTRESSTSPCQSIDIDETVELVVEKPVGEPFTLRLTAYVGNSTLQHAHATGLLTFLLPPGYSIVSCQGFAGPTVPTAPTSWGQLKHAYR